MVVVVAPETGDIDRATLLGITTAPWKGAGAGEPVGIVYIASPRSAGGELLVVDPDWRKVAGKLWIPLFPERLAQKFGALPFEQRLIGSAAYLAQHFPGKIEFLMPETRPVNPDELAVAGWLRLAFDCLFAFVMLYTVFRTIWPARLKPTDVDPQSQEIRRLTKEPFRW